MTLDLKQLQGTPILTEVDFKNPFEVRDGESGDNVIPIGQLWLLKLAPTSDGQGISSERLRTAKVYDDGNAVRVPQCTIGVRRNNNGTLEPVLVGKTTGPLVTAPVTAMDNKGPQPFVLDAERDSYGGTVNMTQSGELKAQLSFSELES